MKQLPNLEKAFAQFKIDMRLEPLLLNCNQTSAFGQHIVTSVKQGNITQAVREIQEQIADGHSGVVIRTIGIEAYKMIAF